MSRRKVTMNKRLAVSAMIVPMALGVPALSATAAHAGEISALAHGTSGSVNTRDSGPKGGTGLFWYDGNGAQPKNKSVIAARDNQGGDHKWVYVELDLIRNGPDLVLATMENKSGKSRNIQYKVVSVKDGSPVRLTVCLSDRNGLIEPYCNSKNFVA
ncbi:hypothetical protein [Actinomadura sp. NTSP31]|uniref:hypothetical protein n=1 Tax=Actinomadura sp. NTSP31 TaxID=1735447 RepID=UPI0035C0E7A2